MSEEGRTEGATAQGTGTEAQQQLALQKIFIKDLSFESPSAPQVFGNSETNPKIGFNLKSQSRSVGDDLHEVVLTITVDAKAGAEEKTLFLVEVQQAGLFMIRGYPEEQVKAIVGAYAPGVLYPYAREAVSDLVVRGGFPPLLLQHINFEAVYAQSQANREAQTTVSGTQTGNA
jgi:preprotein translocase subunit SecB